MKVLLLSTYELGRQPFGLASPAAWLRRAGFDVVVVDTSRTPVSDVQIADASLIGMHLQMHTATRLAEPLIARARRLNPSAHLCCYGLYAPLNASWLRAQGVSTILEGEFEEALVALAHGVAGAPAAADVRTTEAESLGMPSAHPASVIPRLRFIQPDRSGLPPLATYASVQMPDGTSRVSGTTEASRGCKHLCRHCPIVPVYKGQFRVVPVDVVLADVRAQVAAGAGHISFGDPDFFNGPAHAERVVEGLASEWPGLTYDVTIKIEHLLRHAELLPLLRATGCLFVTSAVESIDDAVLERLAKGHTRADFCRAVELCRTAGLTLSPTFVPFTPWTTSESYLELLETIDALDLVEQVAPIQLAIRLLVTARSALLDLAEVRDEVQPFDAASLTWPWRHRDARVDALQQEVIRLVSASTSSPGAETACGGTSCAATPCAERPRPHTSRARTFFAILERAAASARRAPRLSSRSRGGGVPVPCISEPWYCCAEPDLEMGM